MFNRANAALGANWSLHDLRHTAAYRMARDPQMPLTDAERLLVISPELADVLSTIVARIRDDRPDVPLVVSHDKNERLYNPPMPLLFQCRRRLD